MTVQLAQELSKAREELTKARSELEHTRLQLHAVTGAQGNLPVRPAYVNVARRTPPVSIPTPASSTGRAATPEPTFCTVDLSRVPEEHASEVTPVALRRLVENEMRAPGDQPSWRCVAVTMDGGNTYCLRIMGKSKEELNHLVPDDRGEQDEESSVCRYKRRRVGQACQVCRAMRATTNVSWLILNPLCSYPLAKTGSTFSTISVLVGIAVPIIEKATVRLKTAL